MYRFELFLTSLFLNAFLCSAASNQLKELVPCLDEDDCKYYKNATCVKPSCICNGTTFCTETLETVVTKIGEQCTKSQECNMEHADCQNNTCTCQTGYVKATNGRKCLIISEGVGGSCEDSVQCYTKSNHSVCRNKTCICEGMHKINGSCFQNIELGGTCQADPECSLNKFSSCKNSTCTCNDGYIGAMNNTVCLQVASSNNSACVDTLQCTATMGDYSHCVDSQCKCKELYHYKEKIIKCVEDRLFGETCVIHNDCHDVYPEKESRLECVFGECKCRSFYTEKNGICIDKSSSSKTSASLYVILCIYILKYFL